MNQALGPKVGAGDVIGVGPPSLSSLVLV
jgi:hypothetical protein